MAASWLVQHRLGCSMCNAAWSPVDCTAQFALHILSFVSVNFFGRDTLDRLTESAASELERAVCGGR